MFVVGAVRIRNEKAPSEVTNKNALLLVFNTLIKWIHIRFRIPKYFFKVRYVYYSDTGISINFLLKIYTNTILVYVYVS